MWPEGNRSKIRMARTTKKVQQYRQAAQKAADWIESCQSANGAIDPQGGIAPIYKTAFALVTSGRLHAAWRLMDYIAEHYMTEPGEFHAKGEGEFDEAFTFYRNGYILMAALRLGRFDIASPAALAHFRRYQDRSGGFFANLQHRYRSQINPLHSVMGGWICLYTGQLNRAVQAGDFLVRLIQGQPALPRRFYFYTDAKTGRCVTDYPQGMRISYLADRKGPRQHFYYSGAIMGYLADLYRATGCKKYLQAAVKMFDFEKGMNPRSFSWPSKCKVGWGAALLYSVTGDPAHRKMAEKVAGVTFLRAQRRDGSWEQMNYPIHDDGSGFVISSLELTAEFTFELSEIVKAL